MISHRSATHQKLLTGFLAAVLVVAGIIAGMRFAPSDDASTNEASIVVEEVRDIDISGEWIGTTTEDYGDEARYDYRVVFEQEGNTITGILYLTRNHARAIYTETSFSGTIDGNTAFYSSEEILVLENASLDGLCLVETTVRYEEVDGQNMLVGMWVGQANQQEGCDTITGHVLLTRQPE
jgi:hypothetical protein